MVLILLTLVYLRDVLFPGQGRIIQGCDLVQTYYQKFFYKKHPFAHINPYIYSGYPFLAHPYNQVFYPFNWLFLVLPVNNAYSLLYALHIMMAGSFMYLLTGSLLSSIAFMFSGFICCRIWAGHYEVITTSVWIPLVFYLYSTQHPVLCALVLAIQFFAGHTQTSVYTFIILLAYTIYKGSAWWIQASITSLFFGIFASIQLIPTLRFMRVSTRNHSLPFKYCLYGSLNPQGLLRFIFPSIFGNFLKTKDYGSPTRGEVYWEHCYYIGLIPLYLALTSPPSFFKWLALLGVLLALGLYNPVYWLLCRLPIFNKIKWPGRSLIITNFALCILAGKANWWLILLTIIDLFWFAKQFLYLRNESDFYPPKEVVDYLKVNPGKILTLPVKRPGVDWEPGILDFAPNATIPLEIVNVTGYDPFILKSYHDITNGLQGIKGYGQCTIKITDVQALVKGFGVKYIYADKQFEGTELAVKTKLGGLYVVKH